MSRYGSVSDRDVGRRITLKQQILYDLSSKVKVILLISMYSATQIMFPRLLCLVHSVYICQRSSIHLCYCILKREAGSYPKGDGAVTQTTSIGLTTKAKVTILQACGCKSPDLWWHGREREREREKKSKHKQTLSVCWGKLYDTEDVRRAPYEDVAVMLQYLYTRKQRIIYTSLCRVKRQDCFLWRNKMISLAQRSLSVSANTLRSIIYNHHKQSASRRDNRHEGPGGDSVSEGATLTLKPLCSRMEWTCCSCAL